MIPVIPIIYGSLMSWKEESQIFSDQIFHQIEDPLMFQKDSETVESRLKFAPSNGFTQKCPVRPGNIFPGSFHGDLRFTSCLGAPWPIPIATQGSVRYIVTFTSDDVGHWIKIPKWPPEQLESDNPTRNWGYYRTFRC